METLLGMISIGFGTSILAEPPNSERSDRKHAQAVQVRAQRSSSAPQSKPVGAPLREDPPFNPLPLPSSRSGVPNPLKFLWFDGNSQRQESEEFSRSEENREPWTLFDPQTEPQVQELSVSSKAVTDSSSSETLNPAAQTDFKLPLATESSTTTATPSTEFESIRNSQRWIPRIINFRTFWPDSKTTKTPLSTKSFDAGLDGDSTVERSKNGNCCPGSSYACSLEIPYRTVLHTKETFSKFLRDVSLYDLKRITQMSFLCDMAYMIPDIQPGQLLKYHRLMFVTSSLVKKAEAAVKDNESDTSRKLGLANLESQSINSGESSDDGASAHALLALEAPSSSTSASCQMKALVEKTAQPDCGQRSTAPDDLESTAPAAAVGMATEDSKQAMGKASESSHSCPCEWYVCDDHGTHTRIFVIQGSGSLASWQANLVFEPMKFEEFDVLVHRGIYEAAKGLYDEVIPEVLAHFKAHGERAKIGLTGHSLGGSLAALLALMFLIRGVLPGSAILPVITFGSPFIMCGGDYLLQKLNLPWTHIQSVIMHKDVVPRVFTCDYPDNVAKVVAKVLKKLNGRFRHHPCLNNQKLLYAPMGQILILQPDETVAPSHPLLPSGRGLFILRHPINGEDVENAIELRCAQRAFLNMPHPLEIISDPGAYGFEGAIWRDHDPRSYTKAMHVLLRHELKRVRRLRRLQRKQLWWPFVVAESSLLVQKDFKVEFNKGQTRTSGAVTPAVSTPSLVFKQSVNQYLANRNQSPQRNNSVWGFHKEAFSRYARLIASQHVQTGMLFILSVRMVILEGLSMLIVWL